MCQRWAAMTGPPEQADGVGAPGEVAPDVLATGSDADSERKQKRKRKAAPLEQREESQPKCAR